MFPPYKPYIPKGISGLMDYLGMMMLDSPSFIDRTGYLPSRNLAITFDELNEGLNQIRGKLGEERYLKLREMSDRMRAHFEADPENKTDDTVKGREVIVEMENLLKQNSRRF